MLQGERKVWGGLKGIIYDFEKKGDILPKHAHVKIDSHITIIVRGKLKIYSHDWEVIADPGQIIELKEGVPHEFMALEDNTRAVNILRHFTDSKSWETM